MDGSRHGRDLGALAQLCRELARLGVVNVGMSDARPALSVRRGLTEPKTWIEVDASGASFVWRRDDQERHAVDDPAGAAARLAAYLKVRDPGSGEGS